MQFLYWRMKYADLSRLLAQIGRLTKPDLQFIGSYFCELNICNYTIH